LPNQLETCEISGSHGSEYEVQSVWEILPCSQIDVNRRLIVLMMEAARTYETSVDIDLTTWRYIPEDSELQFNFKHLNMKT
jgi:hypothetical protein